MAETTSVESALREALDDLWACIGSKEAQDLQPETKRLAHENHDLLWHPDAVNGTATAIACSAPAITATGKVLTKADFERLADEAEAGYELDQLHPIKGHGEEREAGTADEDPGRPT